MSMTPEKFHDLMVAAVTPEPPQGEVAADVAVGRRLLRRRRAVVTLGSAAAVVAIAGTAWAVAPGSDSATDRGGAPVVTGPTSQDVPRTDAALLEQCRDGNQSDRATAAVFGSGDPVVKAVSRTAHQVILAIESGDGSHWAECFVHLDSQEFASGMTVYDASGRSADTSYSSGGGCGLVDGEVDPSCTKFSVSWVDRRPAAVAAVEFVTGDGRTTTVESRDGYIVLNHLGDVPPGASTDPMAMDYQPIERITFLDAAGKPIAAEAMDGSGTGPDHERVGDLPSIRAYPGLRSGQEIY
ncbi:hypothetical protein ACT8ZV_22050 [Nocardioides sp. MAHUQ-72]|uniref:hypothetical protein n=1 Tax=unclassified Nocardioides TaxID=2615069 RepID=UPI00361E68E1